MSAGHALVLLGGLALVGGWLVTAAADRGGADQRAPEVVAGTVPEIQQLAVDMRARLAELRERPVGLVAQAPRRDLFRFGDLSRVTARVPVAAGTPRQESPASIPAPPVSDLQLAGIAEDREGSRPVRTAIVSSGGQLYLVREGDRVGARFRVLSIGPDAVQFEDLSLARTVTLSLR